MNVTDLSKGVTEQLQSGADFEEELPGSLKSGCDELKRRNKVPTDKACAPYFLTEQIGFK